MSTSTSSTSPSEMAADATVRPVVARLDGAVVGVPDPQATADFFARGFDFDLRDGSDGALELWCEGDYGVHGPQLAVTLVARPALELVELRFAAPAEGTGPLEERLRARGHAYAPDPAGGIAFEDTGGLRLRCAPVVAGDAPPPAGLRPRRLGHANLKTPDPPAAAAFYEQVLGMRTSEQIGEWLYFLRFGAEHHNIGLRGGERGDLHHLGFELAGWESYRPLLDRLADQGHQVEYGPGRHEIGRNMFVYLRDPHSGLRIELFADMAHIRDEHAYVARRWNPEDRLTRTINRWGPLPPESFLA